MDWILRNIPLLIFLVVVFNMVRAVMRAKGKAAEHDAEHDETEDQRRAREIQERIRRAVAERRGEVAPASPLRPGWETEASPPPLPPPELSQKPGDIFRRILTELEPEAQPRVEPPVLAESRGAELARQESLAEELRVLEETRLLAKRRAVQRAAAVEATAQSETGLLAGGRERLLGDLRDPQTLRRAFVLREVLGTPVGLR